MICPKCNTNLVLLKEMEKVIRMNRKTIDLQNKEMEILSDRVNKYYLYSQFLEGLIKSRFN